MGIRACPKLKKPIGTPIGMLALPKFEILVLVYYFKFDIEDLFNICNVNIKCLDYIDKCAIYESKFMKEPNKHIQKHHKSTFKSA